jgi:hypothetical protein
MTSAIEYPIPWSEIFEVYPFKQTLIYTSIFINIVFFTVYFLKLLPNPKQLSWLITVISSTTLTVSSTFFIYDLIQNPFDLTRFSTSNTFSVILSSFFFTTLIWDLVLGVIFYPKYVDPITGWVHHIAYIFALLIITKLGFCKYYALMCPMEAPTVLLALGSINKKLRKDWLFGGVFFVTRIAYHLYSIVSWYVITGDWRPVSIILAFFPMHVIWFRGFILQQIRIAKKKKTEAENQGGNTTEPSPKDPLLNSVNGVSTSIEATAKDYGLKDRKTTENK